MDVEEIFPGVYEMRMEYGRDTAGLLLDGAFPHAVWYIDGPSPALLDPGPTVVAKETVKTLSEMGFDPDSIEYVIPSHIHVDHAGGAGWLVRELSHAQAVFHTRGAPYMRDVAKLAEGTEGVFGPEWLDVFGELLPVPDDRLITVEGGSHLELGGRDYRIVFMPGHSLDHIGVFDKEHRALYCGHGLGNWMPHRWMPETPMTLPYFDVDASIESIRRARDLAPRYLLPVHTGFLATNPGFALDSVERVTIEIGELIQAGMAAGHTLDAMEEDVRTYFFAKPEKADRSYLPTVQAYVAWYERQARKRKPS